jgi:hypothetical protein
LEELEPTFAVAVEEKKTLVVEENNQLEERETGKNFVVEEQKKQTEKQRETGKNLVVEEQKKRHFLEILVMEAQNKHLEEVGRVESRVEEGQNNPLEERQKGLQMTDRPPVWAFEADYEMKLEKVTEERKTNSTSNQKCQNGCTIINLKGDKVRRLLRNAPIKTRYFDQDCLS